MKLFFIMIAACIIWLSGCGTSDRAGASDIEEISERVFATYLSEIRQNKADYLGKTFKVEGIFEMQARDGQPAPYVYRLLFDGCCELDPVGIDIAWDSAHPTDNSWAAYPADDSWVEAVGVLAQVEGDGASYLRLNLLSLTVMEERGEEIVVR